MKKKMRNRTATIKQRIRNCRTEIIRQAIDHSKQSSSQRRRSREKRQSASDSKLVYHRQLQKIDHFLSPAMSESQSTSTNPIDHPSPPTVLSRSYEQCLFSPIAYVHCHDDCCCFLLSPRVQVQIYDVNFFFFFNMRVLEGDPSRAWIPSLCSLCSLHVAIAPHAITGQRRINTGQARGTTHISILLGQLYNSRSNAWM